MRPVSADSMFSAFPYIQQQVLLIPFLPGLLSVYVLFFVWFVPERTGIMPENVFCASGIFLSEKSNGRTKYKILKTLDDKKQIWQCNFR